jgi:UDP-N-acetylmuramyl pentapeptide synthase
VHCAADAAGLAALISPHLTPDDLVLLKGSRGIAMESVLEHLTAPAASEEA